VKSDAMPGALRGFIAAFERLLSRTPTEEELAACLAFLAEQTVDQRRFPGVGTADDGNTDRVLRIG